MAFLLLPVIFKHKKKNSANECINKFADYKSKKHQNFLFYVLPALWLQYMASVSDKCRSNGNAYHSALIYTFFIK